MNDGRPLLISPLFSFAFLLPHVGPFHAKKKSTNFMPSVRKIVNKYKALFIQFRHLAEECENLIAHKCYPWL
jgi:hypothetical protein